MRTPEDDADANGDGRWWRLDFTTILVLLVVIALLCLVTFEFWHAHPGLH